MISIQPSLDFHTRAKLRYWWFTLNITQAYNKMTTDTIITSALTGIATTVATALAFVFTGGYKKTKAETENQLVIAIKQAGEFLAESNESLRKDIHTMTQEYENQLKSLESKFSLKEKEYKLRIENLELENQNLKLENANLILENSKLKKESRVRTTK
jgi:hypothetical protein